MTVAPVRLEGVRFADGSVADVVLTPTAEPAPEAGVFAAMVLLRDRRGRYAVTWSPRRGEWGPPGGWREPGESVVECLVREVAEETGLDLDAATLEPAGHEHFTPVSTGRWPREGGHLQLFVAAWPAVGEDLVAREDDAVDPQWVSPEELRARSGRRFWWPLVDAVLDDRGGRSTVSRR